MTDFSAGIEPLRPIVVTEGEQAIQVSAGAKLDRLASQWRLDIETDETPDDVILFWAERVGHG